MLKTNRKLPRLPRSLANMMIHDLRNAWPAARFCVEFGTGHRILPEELWFPSVRVWLRVSDMTVNGDRMHQFDRWRCGWLTRRRLTAALALYRSIHDD